MNERATDDAPAALEGTDGAALGTTPPPEPAPPGAEVDATERRVPGPTFDRPDHTAKPWASSLAAASHQAGVANNPGGDSADEDVD